MINKIKLGLAVIALIFILVVTAWGHYVLWQRGILIHDNLNLHVGEISDFHRLPVVPEDTLYLLISANDHICLASNIYHEARGESLSGQLGVAFVTVNRSKHPKFPDTICGVVYQGKHYRNWKGNLIPVRNKCQFSWYCDGKSDHMYNQAAWYKSLAIARDVLLLNTTDPTGGATHYYNHNIVDPYWSGAYTTTAMLDNHTFKR